MDSIKEALKKIKTIKLISLLQKTFPYGIDYVSKNRKTIKVFVTKKDIRQEIKDRKPKMTELELEFLKKYGS